MKSGEKMHKVILFVSSYIPLYVLLVIKNILERCTQNGRFVNLAEKWNQAVFFDGVNDWALVFLAGLSIYSLAYLKKKIGKTAGEKNYRIEEVADETGSTYFNYISIYLLSCIGLDLNEIADVFVLFFLMLLVGYIYITNDFIYLNPTLYMMGYKVYRVKLYAKATGETIESIAVCRKTVDMTIGNSICATDKYAFIVSQKNSD